MSFIRFNTIRPSTPRSSQCFLTSGFRTKNMYAFLLFPVRATTPPISSCLNRSPWYYLVGSTYHEAPHYANINKYISNWFFDKEVISVWAIETGGVIFPYLFWKLAIICTVWSSVGSVGVVIRLRDGQPRNRSSILSRDKRFISSPQHPDEFWVRPSPLFSWYWEICPREE